MSDSRCLSCGFCQAACPPFGETLTETWVARGQLAVIRGVQDGVIEPSRRTLERLERCLLCGSCTAACPAGIRVDEEVIAARSALRRRLNLEPGTLKRLVFRGVLPSPRVRDLASRLLPVGFVVGRMMAGLRLPPAPRRTFLEEMAGVYDGVKARAAYFTGCGTNHLFPGVGRAAVKLLNAAGFEVVVPPDQVCCGLPLLAHGDAGGAARLWKQNLDAFRSLGADLVVTDCTSCGMALAQKIPSLAARLSPELSEEASVMATRVRDLGMLLAEELTEDAVGMEAVSVAGAAADVAVTFHDPCHRHWTPGLTDGWRKLFNRYGVTVKEMADPGRCCGGAGSYWLENREMSSAIRRRKLEDIGATGAELVATPCPACRAHLYDGLAGVHGAARVAHPVELLGDRGALGARAPAGDLNLTRRGGHDQRCRNQSRLFKTYPIPSRA